MLGIVIVESKCHEFFLPILGDLVWPIHLHVNSLIFLLVWVGCAANRSTLVVTSMVLEQRLFIKVFFLCAEYISCYIHI